MTDGFIGLNFANDIITLLNGKWKASGGAKPLFQTQWNMKNVGLGSRNYNQVIISIDAENPQIYSMMQGDATDATKFTYDWLHDVSISIDIRTSESELRVMQLVDEIMRILKTNVVPTINNRTYIQMLPEGITSLNEEYRNLYRYLISVSAIKLNP
jgi:hypothetical protein|tara:strand:+ start:689 stop:1156 length:468 start_codon:yes stop_codon:yes gene_type:complete